MTERHLILPPYTVDIKLCSDMTDWCKYYLWVELALVQTALMAANDSLAEHLIASPINAQFHIHGCFFNFCLLTYKYIFWLQVAKKKKARTDTCIYTHKQWEGWQGATQPCIPLCHCTSLNYSVSLKYWYGNHSWLNWRRPERKAAKIHCLRSAVLFF